MLYMILKPIYWVVCNKGSFINLRKWKENIDDKVLFDRCGLKQVQW